MNSYAEFARFYDQIMGDRGPDIERIRGYIRRFKPSAATLLELGCGTGALLADLGKDLAVTGVDRSPQMLAQAAINANGARLVQADMTSFSLRTRFDVVICVFDTLNHLARWESWVALFDRVHEHLADDGIFAFDVNTTGRMRGLWQSPDFAEEFGPHTVLMDISPAGGDLSLWRVRIFERLDGELFRLHQEIIPELAVPLARIRAALAPHFDILEETGLGGGAASDESARAFFACRRRPGGRQQGAGPVTQEEEF